MISLCVRNMASASPLPVPPRPANACLLASDRLQRNVLTPQQQAPAIREECEQNECKEPAKHFKHCADKVRLRALTICVLLTGQIEAGQGWHGEDCVEEVRRHA